jgi:hypothetical protein
MADNDTPSIEERLAKLAKEYPLSPHTGIGRLTTTVRRMRAEKEMDIPINLRTGFAFSIRTGKAANEMTEPEWEIFYKELCEQLRRDYPDMYSSEFPERQ